MFLLKRKERFSYWHIDDRWLQGPVSVDDVNELCRFWAASDRGVMVFEMVIVMVIAMMMTMLTVLLKKMVIVMVMVIVLVMVVMI